MTVDMLAATFFWPEGTALGPHHAQAAVGPAAAGTQEAADAAAAASGFWSSLLRHLWRPSRPTPTATDP